MASVPTARGFTGRLAGERIQSTLSRTPGNQALSGVAYVLLGSAGVAVGNVLLKHLSVRVDPLSATGCQLLLGFVLLFLASATFEPRAVVEWSTPFLVDLAILSVLGTALPFALWFALLRSAELNRLNTFTLLTPVFGLIIGALFYRERLSTVEWVDGLAGRDRKWCGCITPLRPGRRSVSLRKEIYR